MGLDEGIVVAVRRVVAPQCHAQWEVPATIGAQHPPDPRVGAVGHHDVAGEDLAGGAGLLVLDGHAAQLGEVRGRGWRRLVDERCDHLGPGKKGGSGLDGPLGHEAVEVVAGDGVAVAGEIGVLGPLHLDELAEPVGAEPAVLVGAGQGLFEPHVRQLAHRPGGQAVPAGLLTGKVLLLDHGHVPAGVRQPVGARGSRRASADDDDVVDLDRRRPLGTSGSARVGDPQPIRKRRVASPLHRRPEPGPFRPTQDVPRERVPW